jgi:hypothetical protein
LWSCNSHDLPAGQSNLAPIPNSEDQHSFKLVSFGLAAVSEFDLIRWRLVSLILLLCQGFIFENEEEVKQTATLFFGVTAAMMIIVLLVFSFLSYVWRKLKGPSSVCISASALSKLKQENQQDLLQLYSEEMANKDGVFVIKLKSLNRLTAAQRQEVLGIVSRESELLGSADFSRITATYRNRTQELETFTTSLPNNQSKLSYAQ